MGRFPRGIALLLCLLLVLGSGCENGTFRHSTDGGQPSDQPKTPPSVVAQQKTSLPKKKPKAERDTSDDKFVPLDEGSGVDFSFSSVSADSVSGVHHDHPGFETVAAAEVLQRLVKESVDYEPTLIVWLIDQSPSGRAWSADLLRLIGESYASFTALRAATSENLADTPLLTAVCTFGQRVTFPLDPPSSDPEQLANTFDSIALDKTGQEKTFTAIMSCLEKYLPYRTSQRREVIFVMATDEAGDDQDVVEEIAPILRRAGIALYVLGVPAPFGRDAAVDQSVEAPLNYKQGGPWQPIRQGPESVYSERIQLGFCNGGTELDLIDSGFGPHALEYLCQASGGQFLALRPAADDSSFSSALVWPSFAAYNFAPDAMRRYTPDYISPAEYRQLLEQNAARMALHQAARLTGLEMIEFPRLEFRKESVAELSRQLSLAQQSAARLEPAVNALHETLTNGESGRDQLTRPRWQAGYDLALGRATAAKARIDGYNAMLAALKRGKNFENKSSNTWVLQPAETIEASSALRRLVEKAAVILRRVVDEHPATPWAALARHELSMPAGWKWTEKVSAVRRSRKSRVKRKND